MWIDTNDLPEELAPTSIVWKETPTGAVNGTNKNFTTSSPYISGSLQVFVNGLAQSGFTTETAPGSGNFSLDVAPKTGDDIKVQYQIRTVATGNADTVDGFHASATPTPNNIPVLDGNGKIPASNVDFATLRKVLYTGPSATSGSVTMSESIMNFSSVEIGTNRGAVFCLTAARGIVLNRVYSATISNTSGSVITFYSITYRFTSNTTLNIVGGGAVALNASGLSGFSSSNEIAIDSVVGIK